MGTSSSVLACGFHLTIGMSSTASKGEREVERLWEEVEKEEEEQEEQEEEEEERERRRNGGQGGGVEGQGEKEEEEKKMNPYFLPA